MQPAAVLTPACDNQTTIMTRLRIAIAQINCVVGDLAGNRARILKAAEAAAAAGANLLITPELALCGYPPEDLLLRDDFYRLTEAAMQQLIQESQQRTPDLALLIGHPHAENDQRYNAATLVHQGRVVTRYYKQYLPCYEVFDEERYFTTGTLPCVVTIAGVRCGILICADLWQPGAAEATQRTGAEVLLSLNASPYHLDKQSRRLEILRERIAATGLPIVYANLVGGQDELIFDGASCVLDAQGELTHQLGAFEEQLACVDIIDGQVVPGEQSALPASDAAAYQALVLGLRDYVAKNGFQRVLLGLSGGVDSALVLALAVDALGAERVQAVMLPSPYTAQMSLDDATELARRLGVTLDEIAIAPAMQVMDDLLAPQLASLPTPMDPGRDTTSENLQARIRGLLLMAISNRSGALVLTTSNKSESAVGYATLYGDMAGGLAVLKDVLKTRVYRLCHYRNSLADGPVIPDNILTRAPSAELRPNQTDQDSLPDYATLDAIIAAYVEDELSPREIIARGLPAAAVERSIRLLRISEYKRRQSPVGLRITRRGFGRDWRLPITNRYPDEW